MTTSVSVAMATCNGMRYLAAQLESLARQTWLPAELVVTDDASSDDTVKIVEVFARTAPFPVRLHINPKRLGYRANFMKAAQLCESDVIAFCDQDDVWLEDKLAVCIERFVHTDALLVCHNATVTDSELLAIDTLARDAPPAAYNAALSVGPLAYGLGFTLLFRRQLMEFAPLWPQSIDFHDGTNREGHDQWFFFLANVFGPIVYIDTPLACYRRHASAATNTRWAGASWVARGLPFLFENQHHWRNFADSCARRAELLREVAHRYPTHYAHAALAGAERFDSYAQLYFNRLELYNAPSLVERFAVFFRIRASGGYRNHDVWAKGGRSALKDLLVGVFALGNLRKRFAPAAEDVKLGGH
ncbi:glycosyltransferase [Paraburkholderia rhizosphaerae]|uniref:Glycosyltransferase involved in cell wall biosynthesis n=1 Tax=Paraburkholderia rhizosphaerae TaxID=480658 RepID=A0A4R8LHZ3_9BURK|nr:glycosyltransferase [Paraburkholderia rhizosphaerae]TDY42905.1 glycosyltransferase involved in cell wall biosynthesis [Paraburkholderia rhizosphaerae]